ncbi:MerR family transcriptional regulator [Microbacterium sp.]|uniref:MerR family transcriptional regulator n=1 Tax=Microbacterium sp. TaxID=51671 RepID=UPI0027345546|nr:MerR family transcriptional regulator [Microbacterium sp.]MDP3950324.1 MerR family transcriptional regulator [Microbacterium sp.]
MVERHVRHGQTGLTVGAVADLIGVSVRTLHHWDEVGLASPSARTAAGYRQYTEHDVERLHRIIAYREAGLGLAAVREVLDDAAADAGATLRRQRAQLAERIEDLQRLDRRLERMTDAHERGILLSDEEQNDIFGDDWDPRGPENARNLWGGTDQWAQFAERSAQRTPAQWRALSEAMSALQRDLADAMSAGVAPGSTEAEALVERHRELFSNFFTLSRDMQVCLGRMFESDPGFAAHYDGIRHGLASWFRQIIDESARMHGIDPDTAVWR